MNTLLVYFSQTGNTKTVAETMEKAFLDAGHYAKSASISKVTLDEIRRSDVIGVGSPCFEAHAPTPIKQFIKGLPSLQGKKAFVYATAGGCPGKVLYDMATLLKKKGADVIGGTIIRGEFFYPVPYACGVFKGRPNRDDLLQADDFAKVAAEHISLGRQGTVPEGRPDALRLRFNFYEIVGLITTPDFLLRLLMPKPKLDQDRCNQCKACTRECPMDAITIHSYPEIGNKCIRCYRCVTVCPQSAYKVNWMIGNTILRMFYNEPFSRLFGDVKPGEKRR